MSRHRDEARLLPVDQVGDQLIVESIVDVGTIEGQRGQATTVDVEMRGGKLTISWAGPGQPVMMTGPAVTVFEGDIDVPDNL